ncbi:DUF4389 domain-containing protein [Methylococcus sp. ANG]|uniref:DUF4389 domain-containing protein n=1 Tax=Methylococcus sp. ANG TaxID=3231903 RepID=UPI00345AEB91
MSDETFERPAITGIGRRLVFMVFFMVVLGAVRFVFWAIVAFQFLSHLFTGGVNPNAVTSGARLAEYIYRIMEGAQGSRAKRASATTPAKP